MLKTCSVIQDIVNTVQENNRKKRKNTSEKLVHIMANMDTKLGKGDNDSKKQNKSK